MAQLEQFFAGNQLIILLVIWLITLWSMVWKGIALWKAARNSHKKWFIAMFFLNTLAILEILYIFIFSKKKAKNETVQ